MSDSGQDYREAIDRLTAAARQQARLEALGGLLYASSAGIALCLLGMALDQVIVLSATARLALLAASGAVFAGILGFGSVWRLIQRPDLVETAKRIEGHFPELRATLISTVELWSRRKSSREGYSRSLIEAAASDAASILRTIELEDALKRNFLLRSYRSLACVIALGLLYAVVSPSSFYYSQLRLTHPGSDFGSYLSLRPGSTRLVRGTGFEVEARIWGRVPLRADLLVLGEGREEKRVSLKREGRDLFKGSVSRVDEGFTYAVIARGLESPHYVVTVLDRPQVIGLKMEYNYPGYTRLPPVVHDEGVGDISGLVGTRVKLTGRSNVPLSFGAMILDDSTEIKAVLEEEDRFEISTEIKRDGTYHILIRDPEGNENSDPIEYRISAIQDEFPTVAITSPAGDVNLPKDMILKLVVSAADDFGLTRFYVVSQRGEKKERLPIGNLNGMKSESQVLYDWDLSETELLPGEVISYYVEAYDNDTYSGPKKSVSETFRVRFPTLEEIYQQVAEEQDFATEAIETILPEQKRLKERLDELKQELAEQRSLSWEEKQSAEELIERQEKLAEKAEEVASALEDLLDRMDNSFVVDQDIFMKMQMISELLSEVQTEEMIKAMERIREAMKDMNPEEIREAMNRLLMNQEELSRRLERTLEILKRLKQEQELERLAKKAEEIEREHELVSMETEKGGDAEKLAAEEEELRKELEKLKEEMSRLAEELAQTDPSISYALQGLSEEVESQNLMGQMKEAGQMLSQGNRGSACERQKSIQKDLSSLAQGLRKAHSEMLASRTGEIEEAMKEAQEDLLALSEAQEGLNNAVLGMERSTQESPAELGRSQQALAEGVRKVAEKLYDVAQKSCFLNPKVGMHLSAAMQSMDGSVDALESGNTEAAKRAGQNSLVALNSAVRDIMESRESLSSCSSPTGLSEAMESLSGMCDRQMCINQGAQSILMLNPDAGMLSLEARAQIARLAAEQRMISDQLSEIAKGLGDPDQLLGDLDALAKETEEVAEALERSELSREIVERQEKILSRLLDAQRSIRKRDSSPRRRAEVGQDMPWVRAPERLPEDLGEKGRMAQKDLLKALKEAYPKEYEKLIRAYFKSLAE